MTLSFPRYAEPIAEGSGILMGRNWFRWLTDLWREMGFSDDTPIYQTLSVSLDNSNETAVDTDNKADFVMPNNYKEGTDVELFFDWMTRDTNTGNVRWTVSSRLTSGSVLGAAVTEVNLSPASGVDLTVTRIAWSRVLTDTLKKDEYIRVVIERTGTHGDDTYGGRATLLAIGIKYQVEGAGTTKGYP